MMVVVRVIMINFVFNAKRKDIAINEAAVLDDSVEAYEAGLKKLLNYQRLTFKFFLISFQIQLPCTV